MSTDNQTYFERLLKRFKDNPVVAWGMLFVALITALAAFLPASRQLLKDTGLIGSDSPPLNIRLVPFDPRFKAANELMNWGGGSQSVFLELESGITPEILRRARGNSNSDHEETKFVEAAIRMGKVLRIWEVLTDSLTTEVHVDVTYDAPLGAPICVVKEWGVTVTPVPVPHTGFHAIYAVGGGADAAYTVALVQIDPEHKLNPMSKWFNTGSGQIAPHDMATFLKPGEPAFLRLNIGFGHEKIKEDRPNPKAVEAFELRGYARVIVAGKEYLMTSTNAFYAVRLDGSGVRQLDNVLMNVVENLRPFAFWPRDAIPGAKPMNEALAEANSAALKMEQAMASNAVKSEAELATAKDLQESIQSGTITSLEPLLFAIQLGAFQDRTRALRLAENATRSGFPSVVTDMVDINNRVLYRVRLKETTTRENARMLIMKLQEKLPHLTPIVISSSKPAEELATATDFQGPVQNESITSLEPLLFAIQLGAFQDRTRALRLAENATRSGFPSVVTDMVDINNRVLYRVRLKETTTRENARMLIMKLQEKLPHLTPIVISLSP